MYTKERDFDGWWIIKDPQGDIICVIEDDGWAEILLSHLNRG